MAGSKTQSIKARKLSVEKAQLSRRNSLRKQREAQKAQTHAK
jgi:hypothetical protein